MVKKFLLLILLLLVFSLSPRETYASAQNSFVSIVNPVRGDDFWDLKDQKPSDATQGQLQILRSQNLQATFLVRFDALKNSEIISLLKNTPDEKGLFLEVTPTLTNSAGVAYRESPSWHNAASVLLTGYSLEERKKLIETNFEEISDLYRLPGKSEIESFARRYGLNDHNIITFDLTEPQSLVEAMIQTVSLFEEPKAGIN